MLEQARSGLSPMSIELKLNTNDLHNVCVLDHGKIKGTTG